MSNTVQLGTIHVEIQLYKIVANPATFALQKHLVAICNAPGLSAQGPASNTT